MKIQQDDTLVMYVDNEERLIEYINILNEMIDNNKEYQENIHEPSAHLYGIDKRIGYGFEPKTHESYSEAIGYAATQVRDECCEKIVKDAIKALQTSPTRYGVFYGDINEYKKALQEKKCIGLIKKKISDEKRRCGKNITEEFTEEFLYRFAEKIKKEYGIDMESIFDKEQEQELER